MFSWNMAPFFVLYENQHKKNPSYKIKSLRRKVGPQMWAKYIVKVLHSCVHELLFRQLDHLTPLHVGA